MSKQYTVTNSKDQIIGAMPDAPRKYSIAAEGDDDMQVTDGYHTMDELYDHRVTLWLTTCRQVVMLNTVSQHLKRMLEQHQHAIANPEQFEPKRVWRSKRHDDGKLCFDTGTQFVLGIGNKAGEYMTYHIPIELWGEADFAETLERAPEWDGHTSDDVLERLKSL